MRPVPLGRNCEGGNVSSHWEVPSLVGKGECVNFGALEENTVTAVLRTKLRETCTEIQCQLALPSLRYFSTPQVGQVGDEC